jgi:hypothetical protein
LAGFHQVLKAYGSVKQAPEHALQRVDTAFDRI